MVKRVVRLGPLVGLLLAGAGTNATAVEHNLASSIPDATLQALPVVQLARLDFARLAAEDEAAGKNRVGGTRFAVPTDLKINPETSGHWKQLPSGNWQWQYRFSSQDAVHLNFGFSRFVLPEGAALTIQRPDGKQSYTYSRADQTPSLQLWTPILIGGEAVLTLDLPANGRQGYSLELARVSQGYRGFGYQAKRYKSGSCNMDVACIPEGDAWNNPRGSVGAYTKSGTDTCTGSLVNNTNNNQRMLFATAAHCTVTDANVATVLVYWRYENPTCRLPGSGASGTPIPKPNTTSAGVTHLASTNNPFAGSAPGPTRSDWTLIELAAPVNPGGIPLDFHWAGWDRRGAATANLSCLTPSSGGTTAGTCASIHHPAVDEKRITFLDRNLAISPNGTTGTGSAQGVHWNAFWAVTPPIIPSVPPGVTEPGSSGSPLYNADKRLIGVLSGGPSGCGATGNNLSDSYGALFHSWEGAGVAASCDIASKSCMRPHLDPAGSNPDFIDGIGQCTPPAAPTNVSAVANGNNRIDVSWTGVGGISTYRVLRANGVCPGGAFTQVAEVTSGTSYSDTSVSGGSAYSYKVVAVDTAQSPVCPSAQSACDDATATGLCALPPTFAGVATANSAGTAQCGIAVGWNPATGNCGAGSNVRYNVYRDLTPAFTPGPANVVQGCSSTVGFTDITVDPGTRYYYKVRAEDTGAFGSGACGGLEEGNVVERSAQAFGPPGTTLVVDDIESGDSNFTLSGTGAGTNFVRNGSVPRSGAFNWFKDQPTTVSDRTLTWANAIAVTPAGPTSLSFWHRYNMEANGSGTTLYDGGVMEYSLDGGTTWTDVLAGQASVPANAARFTAGAYSNSLISSSFGSPLAGRRAWSGNNNTAYSQVVLNLADFVGQSVLFRLRFASDSSANGTGWWIDDVEVTALTACTSGPADHVFGDGFE